MSANNQAAAQEPAMMAAAAASSEYLKRTCLICGCHTNQTINIYEPRSGPNIVQLIQAKFKFQPLNEDKYLCFSCNNWLINWHSLQAMNSNDADNQSPSHMGNGSSLVQERANANVTQQPVKLRPVAQVRPRQLQIAMVAAMPHNTNHSNSNSNSNSICSSTNAQTQTQTATAQPRAPPAQSEACVPQAQPTRYSKRRFRRLVANALPVHKRSRQCYICGVTVVLRMPATPTTHTLGSLKRSRHAQCRKCREICKWRTLHLRSLAKVARFQRALAHSSRPGGDGRGLVMDVGVAPMPATVETYQRYQQPRVDGKVVAMFRRLGTTMSRECQTDEQQQQQQHARPPQIMSPTKQRPRWTRHLESDEILLEFDSAISEVLPATTTATPAAAAATALALAATAARRRLSYQLTDPDADADANDNESDIEYDVGNDDKVNRNSNQIEISHQTNETEVPEVHDNLTFALQEFRLPQGLSISLI